MEIIPSMPVVAAVPGSTGMLALKFKTPGATYNDTNQYEQLHQA